MSQLKIKDGNSWVNIPSSGIGIPSGGSSGQFLKKSSSTDYATEWANINMPQTTILTPIVTKTSGNSSIEGSAAVKYGNTIQFQLELMPTATTNAGSNVFVGTLSNIPLPAIPTNGCSYMGSCAFVGSLDPDGTITIRVLAANRASSTTHFHVRWTYICA